MKGSQVLRTVLSLAAMVFFLLAAANGFSHGEMLSIGLMITFLLMGMLCIVGVMVLQLSRRASEKQIASENSVLQAGEAPEERSEIR